VGHEVGGIDRSRHVDRARRLCYAHGGKKLVSQ
jgi:hypothetical protein